MVKLYLFLHSLFIAMSLHLAFGSVDIDFESVEKKQIQSDQLVISNPAGRQFTFILSIKEKKTALNSISIPGLENFQVMSTSQSTRTQYINGVQSSSTTYYYTLRPRREGTFSLGPVVVMLNGEEQKSKSATITITAAQTQAQTQESLGAEQEGFVKVELITEKKRVFVDQPIVVKRRLITNVPIIDYGFAPLHATDFAIQELGDEKKIRDMLNNKPVLIIEKEYQLTPLNHGKKKIDPLEARVIVQIKTPQHNSGMDIFDPNFITQFFGPQGKSVDLESNGLEFDVQDIPKQAQNADAIGSFESITLSAEKTTAQVGEPLTIKLSIGGSSNLDKISTPQLTLPSQLRHYASSTKIENSIKTFEFIIQATEGGSYTIPGQKFSFFDPEKERVKLIVSNPLIIEITGHNTPPAHELTKQNNPSQATPASGKISDPDWTNTQQQNSIHWAIVFALAVLSTLIIWGKKLYALLTNTYHSYNQKTVSPKSISTQIKRELAARRVDKLNSLFNRLLAAQLKTQELLSEEAIEAYLKNKGLNSDKVDDFLTFMATCAQMHFAQNRSNIDIDKIVHKASYWLLILTEQK